MILLAYYSLLAAAAFLLLFPATVLLFLAAAGIFRTADLLEQRSHTLSAMYDTAPMVTIERLVLLLCGLLLLIVAVPVTVTLYVLDVLFNQTYGYLFFIDGPGLHMFSQRVQWNVDNSRFTHFEQWRRAMAWARFLNWAWPGHISIKSEE